MDSWQIGFKKFSPSAKFMPGTGRRGNLWLYKGLSKQEGQLVEEHGC